MRRGEEILGLLREIYAALNTKLGKLLPSGNTASTTTSLAFGSNTSALSEGSFAEGKDTVASGQGAHAEGDGCIALGENSHAEGDHTVATGTGAHAEGIKTDAYGNYSHAEGRGIANDDAYYGTVAFVESAVSGAFPHKYTVDGIAAFKATIGKPTVIRYTDADGKNEYVYGYYDFASDYLFTDKKFSADGTVYAVDGVAAGNYAHSEGNLNFAYGESSHAEGLRTDAIGEASHAEGTYTEALNPNEHAEGMRNYSHKASNSWGDPGNTVHSVGIATGSGNKKNAFEIMQNGDIYVLGIGGYDGTNPDSASTLQEVLAALGTATSVNVADVVV